MICSSIRISADNKITPPVIKASRRRRSMQAITKIVETAEYPYDDGHFWKNNGNTVQKKTGCKSVYYKCANSCKVKTRMNSDTVLFRTHMKFMLFLLTCLNN